MTLRLTAMLGPTPQIEAAERAMPDPDGCLFAAASLEGWDAIEAGRVLDGFKEMFANGIRTGQHQRKGPPIEPPPIAISRDEWGDPRVEVIPPPSERLIAVARAIDPPAWSGVDASLDAARRVMAMMDHAPPA